MARGLLAVFALVLVLLGAWGLVDPAGLAREVGLDLGRPGGAAEVRAMYGGLSLGLAIPLAAGARDPAWTRPALLLGACTALSLGTARLLGTALTGEWVAVQWGTACGELAAGFACAALARRA